MLALQETVAVPEPVTLVGIMPPHARPEGAVLVKLTTPANWFTPVIVIVVIEELPALAGLGKPAVIVKFWNWKMVVTVCTRGPSAPVRVSV